MSFTDNFTQHRLKFKNYVGQVSDKPLKCFEHIAGWIDTVVDNQLIFSHRDFMYDTNTFPDRLHSHDYYELVFYVRGHVRYITENTQTDGTPYLITWIKPGQPHACIILEPCYYERYAIYFSREFFSIGNQQYSMPDFISQSFGTHMILPKNIFHELLDLLKKAEQTIEARKPYAELVLKSILIEFFYLLDSQEQQIQTGKRLTGRAGQIKCYIDEKYASISSIGEIAEHFFYSREHLSRKFKQTFGVSVADYLSRRRIMASLPLLESMSIAEAAYAVGFHSQSAFINAFKSIMYCLPSEYKNQRKNP